MNKEEFLELVKQYAHDTCFLSYHDQTHPAYLKLLDEGPVIVPWVLERLEYSIGRDSGDTFDHDNDPWLLLVLLGQLTDCQKTFPREYAGQLDKLREHALQWGKEYLNKNAK